MSAAAMTYTSLADDVLAYSERDDSPLVDQIPRLIMMAENRIASEVRGLGYLKFVNGTMPLTGVLAKPERWRETGLLSFTNGTARTFLKSRSYGYCRMFWPDASVTGQPRFYADYDYEHMLIVPTPVAAYDLELAYFERPEPLSDLNETNWTTQYAPQLILFATLLEVQTFLKLQTRVAEFQAMYDRAAAGVTQEARRRLGDQNAMRTEG